MVREHGLSYWGRDAKGRFIARAPIKASEKAIWQPQKDEGPDFESDVIARAEQISDPDRTYSDGTAADVQADSIIADQDRQADALVAATESGTPVASIATLKKPKPLTFEKMGHTATITHEEDGIRITWNGQTQFIREIEEPDIIRLRVLRDEKGPIGGFRVSPDIIDGIKKMKEYDMMLREEAEKKHQLQEQKEREEKKTGNINLRWKEGSILSDWAPESDSDARLLGELGLTRSVSGWGTAVERCVTKTPSFTKDGESATVSYADLKQISGERKKEADEREQSRKNTKQTWICPECHEFGCDGCLGEEW
jgi:hypothetical protein